MEWLVGIAALLSLGGCSADEEQLSPQEQSIPFGLLTSYLSPYEAVEAPEPRQSKGVTRSGWTPPAGFTEAPEPIPVGAFFTTPPATSDARRIWCNTNGAEDVWLLSGESLDPGSYHLYGYMPYNAASVTIMPNGTYDEGAVLVMNGLNNVSSKDVCVMVGAKEGTSADDVEDLQAGQFSCLMRSGGPGNSNYLFLLFEHLYVALRFRFRVDTDYDRIRTIHLKRLELTACTSNTYRTLKKETINATVRLQANNTGDSPIQSVAYENNPGSPTMSPILLNKEEVVLQTGENWKTMDAYVPQNSQYFILRSTYDVYDKMGNMIRKNSVAENKLDILSILKTASLERGHEYILKLTVAPTYVYKLSDEDVDSPAAVLE